MTTHLFRQLSQEAGAWRRAPDIQMTTKSLKVMFEEALERQGETFDDVIVWSHPLLVLEQISTLEEIQCWYLNSCGYYGEGDLEAHCKKKGIDNPLHKQDMPFIAVTARNIYYATYNQKIENPRMNELPIDERYKAINRFVAGVECYSRDDT